MVKRHPNLWWYETGPSIQTGHLFWQRSRYEGISLWWPRRIIKLRSDRHYPKSPSDIGGSVSASLRQWRSRPLLVNNLTWLSDYWEGNSPPTPMFWLNDFFLMVQRTPFKLETSRLVCVQNCLGGKERVKSFWRSRAAWGHTHTTDNFRVEDVYKTIRHYQVTVSGNWEECTRIYMKFNLRIVCLIQTFDNNLDNVISYRHCFS